MRAADAPPSPRARVAYAEAVILNKRCVCWVGWSGKNVTGRVQTELTNRSN